MRPPRCAPSRYVYLTPPQVATCDVVVIPQYSRKSVNFGVSPRIGPTLQGSTGMDKLKTVLSGEEARRDDRTILEVNGGGGA